MRIYVASSWRNETQPAVVDELRRCGHDVYDFRRPPTGDAAMRWPSDRDSWSAAEQQALWKDAAVQAAFRRDMAALAESEATVLVAPAGRSAHLELGWASGAGQRTAVLVSEGEPELMYGMVDGLCTSLPELCDLVAGWAVAARACRRTRR